MTEATVKAVEELERQCFSRPWSLSSLEAELDNPQAVFLTAGIEGVVAGYAGMHDISGEGYITNVAVSPDYRRRGVARELMESLIGYGEEKGLAFITLEVRESNMAARLLYESLGFSVAGKRRRFYENPAEDGIIMTLEFCR